MELFARSETCCDTLVLCAAEAVSLAARLALALADVLAMLWLCDADPNAALTLCECTPDRLADAEVLALPD